MDYTDYNKLVERTIQEYREAHSMTKTNDHEEIAASLFWTMITFIMIFSMYGMW